MTTGLRVAVVQGGPSSEAEVSRASAGSVADALIAGGHGVQRFELDTDLAAKLAEYNPDVVFPVVHGAVGEDGALAGLFEVLGLPFVGTGVLGGALAMHKGVARALFAAANLPIARGVVLPKGPVGAALRQVRAVSERVVIKPVSNGSAIGVSRLEEGATDGDIANALEAVWAIDDEALVEHFAKGREVTCGVLDAVVLGGSFAAGPTAFSPTEIESPNDAFYTFSARYAPGRSVHRCPADLSSDVGERVRDIACRAHRALRCRDLSRVDFVVGDDGDPTLVTLLEVNTMPGFTGTSLYPEAAQVAGLPMPRLVDALVRTAALRGNARRNRPLALPT
jgi:D-alanine-D-alanine ligase